MNFGLNMLDYMYYVPNTCTVEMGLNIATKNKQNKFNINTAEMELNLATKNKQNKF